MLLRKTVLFNDSPKNSKLPTFVFTCDFKGARFFVNSGCSIFEIVTFGCLRA